MSGGLFPLSEFARRLENEVHAEIPPGQLGRVLAFEHRNFAPGDLQGAIRPGHGFRKGTAHGIVFQQVGQHRSRIQIVDGNYMQILRLPAGPENIAADAPESVDGNFYSHESKLPVPRPKNSRQDEIRLYLQQVTNLYPKAC